MGIKSGCCTVLNLVGSAVLEYDTPKIVHIENKTVGLLNRLVQVGILLYILVWGIIIQKGYQLTGPVTGTITTKLKGASHYDGHLGDYSSGCVGENGVINRTFDVGDYVIPPEEPNSFFVMTNLWQTCNQTQGVCAESSGVFGSNCTLNAADPDEMNVACLDPSTNQSGRVFEAGNGPTTGRCVNTSTGGQCEIRAWCDVEMENDEITNSGPKINASQFTVLVKNSIEFPTVNAGKRKRNIKETADGHFLKTCRFNASDPDGLYCPIFSLEQIVHMIKPEGTFNISYLSTKGAVVGLEIHWDCDHLERNLNHCHPKYVAKRYDDPQAKISQGFNFRFSRYYYEDNVEKRILTKAYGVLFKIEVHGTGGKFDFFTFVLKIGSMIALLGIATVVSDILVLYVLKGRKYYRENKYQKVSTPALEYEVIDHKDADESASVLEPKTNIN